MEVDDIQQEMNPLNMETEETLSTRPGPSQIGFGDEKQIPYTLKKVGEKAFKNKRSTGLNGHLSIRDFTLTSCQKGSYLYINSPNIE